MLTSPFFKNQKFLPVKNKKPLVASWEEALPGEQAKAKWPNEELAMIAGDLLCIDVDIQHDGKEEDVYAMGFPRDTWKNKTPRGGCHLIYKPYEGFKIGNLVGKLAQGVDVRFGNGYIVVPPSTGYVTVCDAEPKSFAASDIKLPEIIKKTTEIVQNNQPSNADTIKEGRRHATLLTEGGKLRRAGAGEIVLNAALHAMNRYMCNPSLSEFELNNILSSLLKFSPDEMFEKLEFKKTNSTSLEDEEVTIITARSLNEQKGHETTKWIWRDVIPEAKPSLIFGDGGVGKSTLAIQICKDILEREKTNTVLWCPVEGNIDDTREKVDEMEVDVDRFAFLSRGGDESFQFEKPEDLIFLDRYMNKLRPKIVIVDSLRSMSKKEINHRDYGEVMRELQQVVCQKYGATLLYLHHENKAGEAMGTQAIKAQCRIMLQMLDGIDGKTLVKTKSNIGNPPELLITKQGNKLAIGKANGSRNKQVEEVLKELFQVNDRIGQRDTFNAVQANLCIPDDKMESLRKSIYKIIPSLGIRSEGNKATGYYFVKGR